MSADLTMAKSRADLLRALRDGLDARGYLEVETPIAVPVAGQEPHLRPFETRFTPDAPIPSGGVDGARRLHLHTSPEYAMKRLLSRGFGRIWQIARVFRDGEISRSHNPEFTLLEFYAAPGSAATIMADLEQLVADAARALRGMPIAPAREGHGRGTKGQPLDLTPPFERVSCSEAFRHHAGFDSLPLDAEAFAQAARTIGVRPPAAASWDELFTQVLIERVEPALGLSRPTYLTGYPASQAALARLVPGNPRIAERFELYAAGLELANGFSELTDAREQRLRLESEQRERARLGREVFPLDERFLDALGRMPPAGGVAVGVDRLLMLLTGAKNIADVLSFPAVDEYPHARRA
ncbi:MAG TPA: EF-P lysine aminoacylase EpmA [Myxococcales bacterium]|jgi:lysyl-tRNA synthetase class 2|nr:EF-P lysine aminoacylase EpmA [Myxococcales bacterium]